MFEWKFLDIIERLFFNTYKILAYDIISDIGVYDSQVSQFSTRASIILCINLPQNTVTD